MGGLDRRRAWAARALAVALLATAPAPATGAAPAAAAQPLDELVTDAPVRALVRTGDRLYLGGDFTYVGPRTGGAAALDPGSGALKREFPIVDGPVLAVAPDGSGGFYVGGNFQTVGGLPRRGLAHVLAGGAVDPAFDPAPNDAVYALALDGGRLYVGGAFQAIGGRSRNRLAALDAATGVVDAQFDPNIGFEGVALQAPPPPPPPPSPAFTPQPSPPSCTDYDYGFYRGEYLTRTGVLALAVAGGRLYVGGSFSSVGGADRSNLAAVDAATGALDPAFDPDANSPGFNPQARHRRPDANGPVDALALEGGRLYAAGRFSSVAGRSRAGLAALDAGSGAVDAGFDPVPEGRVHALAAGGGRVFVAGEFKSVGGLRNRRLAVLDAVTGTADPAFAPRPDGDVLSVALSGGRLYAGGRFTTAGGLPRKNLAALDPATGAADPAFVAHADGPGFAIAAGADTVYAGGFFESAGGEPRPGLAALDLAAGAIDQEFVPDFEMRVRRIAVARGRLFASGPGVGGGGSWSLVAADADSGALDPGFHARVDKPSGPILASAGRLYVAPDGEDRVRPALVALDAANGRRMERFAPRLYGTVYTLAGSARRIYVGGALDRFVLRRKRDGTHTHEPEAASGLQVLDGADGSRVRGFSPQLGGGRGTRTAVYAVHRAGAALYVTGEAEHLRSGSERPLLLKLRAGDGAAVRRFSAPGIAGSSLATARGRLIVNGRPRGTAGVSALDARTGRLDRQASSRIGGRTCAVAAAGDTVFAGGSFDLVDRVRHPHFAALALG